MNPQYISDKTRVACGTAVWVQMPFPDQFAMIKRTGAHGEGQWSVPGGWVAQHEDPYDGAIREVWEEIGITVEHLEFMGYTYDRHEEGVEGVTLWFFCRFGSWHGQFRNTNPDRITEVTEMSIETIREMPLELVFLPVKNLNAKDLLPDVWQGRRLS